MRTPKAFLILLTLVFIFTVTVFPALAEEPVKSITTNGEGIIKALPEVAFIYLSIEGHGKTAKEAKDKNAVVMNNVIKKLKVLGISKEEIQAVSFNVSPVYNYSPGKDQNKITGYQASSQLIIKTDKLNDLGNIIDTAIDAGANNTQNISYSVKDEDAWSLKALEKATLIASKKAKVIAQTLRVTIKGVNGVNEQGAYVRTYDANPRMLKASPVGATAESTPIQAPEFIEIRANVTINFGI